MRRSLCLGFVMCVALVLHGAPVLAQLAGNAEAVALAETLDGLKQQKADAQAKENELRQKQAKLSEAIRQTPEALELQEAANQARAERDEFVATDPAVKEVAEQLRAAQQARQKTHVAVVAESEKGKTIAAERQETSELLAVNNYEIRLNDFVRQSKVRRKVSATPAVASAQEAERTARTAWEQARREKEQSDEMREMARETGILRRKYEAIRKTKAPEELIAAEKALRDAEEGLRKVRDADLGALLGAVEEARKAQEKAIAAKLDADDDAKTLNREMAELREQSADTQYKLRLADFKLREGVRGKISRSSEIQALAQEIWKADWARQQAERESKELAAAQETVEKARAAVNELSSRLRHKRPETVAALNAQYDELAAAEKVLRYAEEELGKVREIEVGPLTRAVEEARKAHEKAIAAKLDADEEAKALNQEMAELREQSAEIYDNLRLAEFKLRDGVRGKISRSSEIQALTQEIVKADRARQQAEHESKELAAARKAVEEARTKVNELRPTHQALKQAEDAWRAADKKYREQIDAAVADEREAWDEKRKAVQEALKAAMAADAAAQELASEKEALTKVSQELHEKHRELNNKYHELNREMAANDEVKAAQEAERTAHENYQEVYRASKAPELDKKYGAARDAYHQKIRELTAADETYVEVAKDLAQIRERMRSLDQAIREKQQQAAG